MEEEEKKNREKREQERISVEEELKGKETREGHRENKKIKQRDRKRQNKGERKWKLLQTHTTDHHQINYCLGCVVVR